MKQFFTAAAAIFSFALIGSQPVQAAEGVGLIERQITVAHHERKLPLAVMYPAIGGEKINFADNAVFHGTELLRSASPISGERPVVLLSHGWGGNYARMAWLGAALASKRAIVISVNHPNSTTFDIDYKNAFRHWTRVQDLSAALDHAFSDEKLAPLINKDRVYAVGFSYGGWTALSMGGARANRAGFQDYCAAAGSGSQFCTMLKANGFDIRSVDKERYEASYKDRRIKGVAAIDPGLTWGARRDLVADLPESVLLVGLGEGDDRLQATDTSASGSNFEALLPSANVQIVPQSMHFTALGLCKPQGEAILREENDDPVCTDPTGSNRADALEKIVDAIVEHFGL